MTKIEMAEAYRLQQARELLLSLGYEELPDGNFRKPAQQQPQEVTPQVPGARHLDPHNPATCETCEG